MDVAVISPCAIVIVICDEQLQLRLTFPISLVETQRREGLINLVCDSLQRLPVSFLKWAKSLNLWDLRLRKGPQGYGTLRLFVTVSVTEQNLGAEIGLIIDNQQNLGAEIGLIIDNQQNLGAEIGLIIDNQQNLGAEIGLIIDNQQNLGAEIGLIIDNQQNLGAEIGLIIDNQQNLGAENMGGQPK
ncbi:hypothetical protein CEXT_607521 [Caerostris extrusa]|uniref:Uncharacterized protein n=1 Tax=Caerostris extrusa TaxID=172846 RepID=A0AAV4VN09_CAEEX|nr:hypothetical protein CEXT_607521 [Caerostris extrusa]